MRRGGRPMACEETRGVVEMWVIEFSMSGRRMNGAI
jgi:hypothetical protein